jgi:hypothetical protein
MDVKAEAPSNSPDRGEPSTQPSRKRDAAHNTSIPESEEDSAMMRLVSLAEKQVDDLSKCRVNP